MSGDAELERLRQMNIQLNVVVDSRKAELERLRENYEQRDREAKALDGFLVDRTAEVERLRAALREIATADEDWTATDTGFSKMAAIADRALEGSEK